MVSTAEIRRSQQRQRQQRRATGAGCTTLVIGLAASFVSKSQIQFSVALAVMFILLIYALFQLDWIIEAKPCLARFSRIVIGIVAMSGLLGIYGWFNWPSRHRHVLSKAEHDAFEKPLKDLKQPQMSIHLYCAPEDEVDCEYAADLTPLFGEAGWNVASTVDRITLGRPKSGILIGLHGTVKPEDEPKLKWNEGEWTQIRPEMWAVRRAFVNVGIEPDSTSGATVPENQINIYVGHEREDESAPTDMTRVFENFQRQKIPGVQ
jgi:hypothetical protein